MLLDSYRYSSNRRFSVFNEFSKKVKGEVERYWILHTYLYSILFLFHESLFILIIFCNMYGCRHPEFHQSVKELKEKAEELKGVKDELKVR